LADEIVALAVLQALPGKEGDLVDVLREFYGMMKAKGYSRDSLHRDAARPGRFLHLRYWESDGARSEAQIDPEVHRYWQKLPELCTIPEVYERLETVFET
jgi:quinol monooxygenase YgiN